MNVEIVKATLLSEIQELEESLQIIARRVQQGDAVGSHTNIDSSKVNNLIVDILPGLKARGFFTLH